MTPEEAAELIASFPDHWWLPGTGVSNKRSAAEEAIDRAMILAAWEERQHPGRRRRGEETDA